ncbi:acyl-CoA desaturase [Candidatus Peregrinibacteria bacterium]|nr:acyl-CoA desaturase [Candidatus Peregrinibacteria bacterium]
MTDRVHNIRVLSLVGLPFIAGLIAIVFLWGRYVFWTDIVLMFGGYVLTTMGVCIGYHRMLTHKGFEAPAWLRWILLTLGAMAPEAPPDIWAATHIVHHAHSDEEGDPHSPIEGFWHAHIGWLFKQNNFADPKEVAPHLLEDPVVVWVSKWTQVLIFLSFLIPFVIGGWTGLIWGGGVRAFLTTHVTWSVNSICHLFGKRPYNTTDGSRNNWLIGLLGFGEGWHNNHHAFPENAFHGMHWWQVDLSGWTIRIWELLGIVRNVRRVTPQALASFATYAEHREASIAEMKTALGAAIVHAEEEACAIFARTIEQSVSSFDKDQCREVYEAYLRQLWSIRQSVEQSTRLKKKRLMAYFQEVQKGAGRVKEVMQRKLVRS